ncbi:ROK family transcriptional regulator [Streptomyces sp. NPDC088197]|uniref:ROK family transcriptional regulator n=1 Tax=Streptomyces sp. NPDC088197 TaxID=3365840 RepID=UPI0037FCA879
MNPSAPGANLPALRSHNAALVLGLLRTATLSPADAGTDSGGTDSRGTSGGGTDSGGTSGGGTDSGGTDSRGTSGGGTDSGGTSGGGTGRGGTGSGGTDGRARGISRLELAERTGLTPQAVSKITARLRAEGLVEEAGRRASTGGKPRTELRLVSGARHAVGVHLDGERLTAVLTDLTGRTVAEREAPLDLGLPVESALAAIVHEVRLIAARAPGAVLGVGVGMRGPLDHRTGTLHRVTGFPHWQGVPLRARLAAALGLPVALDKNTNAAALSILAEAVPAGSAPTGAVLAGTGEGSPPPAAAPGGWSAPTESAPAPVTAPAPGAGRPASGAGGPATESAPAPGGEPPTTAESAAARPRPAAGGPPAFAYLHLGAGLGAGLVLGGEVYRGGRTGAGEFGHQAVELGGVLCECGNRGCLEALCLAAAGRGDTVGAARLLGVGAANLVALLDIDRVVLGGRTVLAAPAVFAEQVAAVLAERGRSVPVGFAAAGPRAVAEGAALLVLAPLFGNVLTHA